MESKPTCTFPGSALQPRSKTKPLPLESRRSPFVGQSHKQSTRGRKRLRNTFDFEPGKVFTKLNFSKKKIKLITKTSTLQDPDSIGGKREYGGDERD
ncbi:hypothetical protein V6N13_060310 [Hibiscus sabdariffa]